MSEKLKSKTFQLYPTQSELLKDALELCKKNNPHLKFEREYICEIVKIYLKEHGDIVILESDDIRTKDEMDLNELCPIGVLKKIVDPKDGVLKWYCLRGISLRGKGNPKKIADGRDISSIRAYCLSCEKGTSLNEQMKRTYQQVLAIKKFGEEEIKVNINTCIHPDNDFLQVLLGDTGELICTLQNKRININKVCIPTGCEYFQKITSSITVKETKPFKEFQEALEDKSDQGTEK